MIPAKEAKILMIEGEKRRREKQSRGIESDMTSWKNRCNELRPALMEKIEKRIRDVAASGGNRCILSCLSDDDAMASLFCEAANELNGLEFRAEIDKYVTDKDNDSQHRNVLYIRWDV